LIGDRKDFREKTALVLGALSHAKKILSEMPNTVRLPENDIPTVNDVRKLYGLSAVPGGDRHCLTLTIVSNGYER